MWVFLKHLFKHKKNKEEKEVVENENKQQQLNKTKIYIDENMAYEIVNILNNIDNKE